MQSYMLCCTLFTNFRMIYRKFIFKLVWQSQWHNRVHSELQSWRFQVRFLVGSCRKSGFPIIPRVAECSGNVTPVYHSVFEAKQIMLHCYLTLFIVLGTWELLLATAALNSATACCRVLIIYIPKNILYISSR